jgi:hypothetical protein
MKYFILSYACPYILTFKKIYHMLKNIKTWKKICITSKMASPAFWPITFLLKFDNYLYLTRMDLIRADHFVWSFSSIIKSNQMQFYRLRNFLKSNYAAKKVFNFIFKKFLFVLLKVSEKLLIVHLSGPSFSTIAFWQLEQIQWFRILHGSRHSNLLTFCYYNDKWFDIWRYL